ncbi:hypothetical protein Tco_0918001 [Tanacetum coccineum]
MKIIYCVSSSPTCSFLILLRVLLPLPLTINVLGDQIHSKSQPYNTWNDFVTSSHPSQFLLLPRKLLIAEVLGLSTAHAIWTALARILSNFSVERIHSLRDSLRNLSKGTPRFLIMVVQFKGVPPHCQFMSLQWAIGLLLSISSFLCLDAATSDANLAQGLHLSVPCFTHGHPVLVRSIIGASAHYLTSSQVNVSHQPLIPAKADSKSAAKHPQGMAALHDEMEALKQNWVFTKFGSRLSHVQSSVKVLLRADTSLFVFTKTLASWYLLVVDLFSLSYSLSSLVASFAIPTHSLGLIYLMRHLSIFAVPRNKPTVSRFSCESEYRAMAKHAAEIFGLTHLLSADFMLLNRIDTTLCVTISCFV